MATVLGTGGQIPLHLLSVNILLAVDPPSLFVLDGLLRPCHPTLCKPRFVLAIAWLTNPERMVPRSGQIHARIKRKSRSRRDVNQARLITC